MHTARRTFVATGTVALLAAAGVTAAIAADPAPPPPPRIAFVANGIVPADALAAGPIAGQLGAPIYTTQPDTLSPAAATGLDDYDPELVIVLGGPVAIHDTVIEQVEDATGLTESADATPAGGIVRAAGGDRFDTAAAVADLLTAYNPAFLPIDMQAIDADTVDGKHARDLVTQSEAADHLKAGELVLTSREWMRNENTEENLQRSDAVDIATRSGLGAGYGSFTNRPTVPVAMHGVTHSVSSAEVCFDASDAGVTVESLYFFVMEQDETGNTNVASAFDVTSHGDSACVDLVLDSPVALTADRALNVSLTADWTDPDADLQLRRVTYTLTAR